MNNDLNKISEVKYLGSVITNYKVITTSIKALLKAEIYSCSTSRLDF